MIPVEVAADEQESIGSLRIVDARGELRFKTSSWSLYFVSTSGYLIAALVVLSIIHLLRNVLRDVAGEEPFGLKNAKRIRAIGFLFLLAGVLGPIAEHVAVRIVLARLPTLDPALSAPLSFTSDIILTGLLILILAQVWAYGSHLEREQALTI